MIMDQMQLEQEKLKTIIREIDKNIADYQLEKGSHRCRYPKLI